MYMYAYNVQRLNTDLSFCICDFKLLFCFILFSDRAWREKLEQAEIRKREETKELQVTWS